MKKLFLLLSLSLFLTPLAFSDTVSEDRSDFDKVYNVIDDAVYDIRYYSNYNFTGNKINGYNAPVAYMTKEALSALSKAAEDLRSQGYRLLIWDTYRPQKAVDNFVTWINNPKDDGIKAFYPKLKKSQLV